MRCQRAVVVGRARAPSRPSTTANSSLSAVDGSGTAPAFSNSTPLCTSSVASPPSSRIMFGPPSRPRATRSACSVHHQYSSSVSPFHANTGTPGARRSARRRRGPGWRRCCSDAQRTSAPSATSVSMSTAVWIVMCSEPVMRAPASGLVARVALAQRHEAGHLVLGELDLLAAERRRARDRRP